MSELVAKILGVALVLAVITVVIVGKINPAIDTKGTDTQNRIEATSVDSF